MARPKTYIIKLTDGKRDTLYKIISDKKNCKTAIKRCQILLELDEVHGTGLTHSQLAHRYAVCPTTITNVIQSYVKNGIKDIIRTTSVQIPALHYERWTYVLRHASSRWPVIQPQRGIHA